MSSAGLASGDSVAADFTVAVEAGSVEEEVVAFTGVVEGFMVADLWVGPPASLEPFWADASPRAVQIKVELTF